MLKVLRESKFYFKRVQTKMQISIEMFSEKIRVLFVGFIVLSMSIKQRLVLVKCVDDVNEEIS